MALSMTTWLPREITHHDDGGLRFLEGESRALLPNLALSQIVVVSIPDPGTPSSRPAMSHPMRHEQVDKQRLHV